MHDATYEVVWQYWSGQHKPFVELDRWCEKFDTNIHSLERVEKHFPAKKKKEKKTHFHTHHTCYVFATAKLCRIAFTQNPEQNKFSTCHNTIPPIHLAKKETNCYNYHIKKKCLDYKNLHNFYNFYNS